VMIPLILRLIIDDGSTTKTPRPMSSTTAREPVVTMASTSGW
jgi:hypothetical protein